MSALTTPTYSNKREKKRKKMKKKKLQQAIERQRKAKRKITWRRHVSNPLGKGNDSTHPRQTMLKQECKPPNQSSKHHKELPLHTCKLPLNQCNSPWTNACKPLEENRVAASTQLWPVRPVTLTGQTGGQDRPASGNYTGQTGAPHRSGRCHLGNCPSSKIAWNHLETF
jgi:hypothetical protein